MGWEGEPVNTDIVVGEEALVVEVEGDVVADEEGSGRYDANAQDVTLPPKMLQTDTKSARNELLHHLNGAFRTLCGVHRNERWPSDPDEERRNPRATEEVYLNPVFAAAVNDPRNVKIRRDVANHVWLELKGAGFGEKLINRSVKWNKESLFELSKVCFSSFREEWQMQNNTDRESAKIASQRDLRRFQRRKAKAARLLAVIEPYKDEHDGADPGEMIIPDLMSDEASGPEEGGEETVDQWKERMAAAEGMNPEGQYYENTTFHEVLRCPWRSELLDEIINWLRNKWWESLTVKQRKRFTTHWVRTGRPTRRIPNDAPWDCCINEQWHQANVSRPELDVYKLGDWYKFGDPPGFSGAGAPRTTTRAGSRERDTQAGQTSGSDAGGGREGTSEWGNGTSSDWGNGASSNA